MVVGISSIARASSGSLPDAALLCRSGLLVEVYNAGARAISREDEALGAEVDTEALTGTTVGLFDFSEFFSTGASSSGDLTTFDEAAASFA